MRANPISDSLSFLLGHTHDQDALGPAGYVLVAFYFALLLGGVAAALVNWTRDPAQRTARNVWIWLIRTLVGSMWFQGSLWKLPLPVSGGLKFWTGELAKYSAFAWHAAFVDGFLIPNLVWLGPLVWLAEMGMTVSLVLGLATRLGGLVGVLFTLNLCLGLYNDPTEWPWTYVFLIFLMALLALDRAGRGLGLDAIILRRTWRRRLVPRAWRIIA